MTGEHTGAILRLRRVTRWFPQGVETVPGLDGVSVALQRGELTVAAGPSGSGKTTLLSVAAGTESPDAGTVHTRPPLPPDTPPARLSWRHLGYVPQALGLLDELTVAENVDLPATLDPGSAGPRSRTVELLEQLEIDHLAGRYPSLTSGGEQQRAAVARALRLRPPLLLADEPTGHQDRERVDLVLAVLRAHAHRGNAVLLSSHDPTVIAAADRVLTLSDGRLVDDQRAGARAGTV